MDGLWLALVVFILRIVNNALGTIRVVFIARQLRIPASLLAFVESLIFAYTVANVVNDLSNPVMLIAYSAGFAVGSYVGMWLERQFVQAFMSVNIISTNSGHEMAIALREAGFGVTETLGEGRDGLVSMLRIIADRRDTGRVVDIARTHNPDAFIAMEEARGIRQGYVRRLNGRR